MSNLWNKLRTAFSSKSTADEFELNSSLQTQVLEKLSQAMSQLTDFPEVQEVLEVFKTHLYRPLQVAIVGEYNAGKSTFLNAVLQESVLPTGDLPTTGCVNYIRFGNTPSIVAHYKDDSSESLAPDQLRQISTHDHTDPHKQHILQQLKYIEVFKQSKILEKIVFVDTPGLNAPTEADREITEKLLNESDAIIWLTSARQVLAATEVDVLEMFSDRYKGKSLCVISQVDSLNSPRKEAPQLLKYAKETLADYFTDIVAVSALEAINGNEESMKSFYTAFWRDIIPRSQEMVVQTILLDTRNLLNGVIEDVQEKQERISKLQASLSDLQQKVGNVTNQMLKNVKELRSNSAREFRRLQDELITRAQQECTTWTDYVPYTRRIQRMFVDDYVVDYRSVERWHWEDEKVNKAHEWIAIKAENIMDTFVEQCQQVFQNITETLEQLNTSFKSQNEDMVSESSLNTMAQHLMIANEFRDMIGTSRSYFWGAMNHGGVSPVSWIIFLDKSETRPSTSRVTDLVKGLLPLDRLIQIMNNAEEFEKSIRSSVNACYEWLEEKISSQSQQAALLMNSIKEAKKCL